MISLNRLAKTVLTTQNFSTAIRSRQTKERVQIKFRNGLSLKLTWAQFVHLRDNYQSMRGFSINQLGDDLFRIKNEKLDLTCPAQDVSLILKVNSKYTIEQLEDGLFKIESEQFELVGSYVASGLIFLVNEYLNGDYKCNCSGKVVLDIGGFQGETAVFFSLMGAKKVVIYEPITVHQQFIRRNVELNGVDAEIYEEGIGDKTEVKTISYDEITVGLGLDKCGSKKMTVKIRDASEVIERSGAQIAKLDCEGGESSLLKVPSEILRKIEVYMIETHSAAVKSALLEKFGSCGFRVTKNTNGDPCSIVHFERIN
jgi:FkbM family methyltransferase